MTPRSHQSDWVHNELSRAKRKEKPVFPLLLEGEQWLSVEAIQYVNKRMENHGQSDRIYQTPSADAYFVLTYAFSWALWIPLQQLVLDGQVVLRPLISLGIFGPALVGIGLSALLKPRPRQGSRTSAAITFIAVWIIASLIITIDAVVSEQLALSPLLVVISVVTAMLPAFVVSSAFSTVPGVKDHLSTLVKPRGATAYYLLALILFPAIWLLGIFVSRAMGMEIQRIIILLWASGL